MSPHNDPPPPSGEDWETSLFIHAKRFPVKKALKLAQSLDFGFSAPVQASEDVVEEASFLEMPQLPDVEPFIPPEPLPPSVEDTSPAVLMPPHVAGGVPSKTPQRPTAGPLPPMGSCFEDSEPPLVPEPLDPLPMPEPVVASQDNEAAFEVFLRTLLDAPRSEPQARFQPSVYHSPVFQAPLPIAVPMTASVSIQPAGDGAAAGVSFAFATTGIMPPEVPIASGVATPFVPEPAPPVAAAEKQAAPMALPVVVSFVDQTQAQDTVFRMQTLPSTPASHPDVVLPLLDLFVEPEAPMATPSSVETPPILSVVPDLETPSADMGTVLPFRREASEDSPEASDDTVVPFPVKPLPVVVEDEPDAFEDLAESEDNPPVPEALKGFSLEFPDFSLDDPEDAPWGFVSSPPEVREEADDLEANSVIEVPDWFTEDEPESADMPSVGSPDTLELPELEDLMVPDDLGSESVEVAADPLAPFLDDMLGQWEANVDLDEYTDEDAPEEGLDILASASLGDEFQMLLVHLDGLYALMVDNGENAVLLKTFDANPLSVEDAFMVSEEAMLDTGKVMYLAHVGAWQGIIALEGDDATIQAEMPWSDD